MTPAAPAYMSSEASAQWRNVYEKALAQAKIDSPNNASAQRAAALKAANALLSVSAPKSASDIDKLAPWQVLVRETRVVKKTGEQVRVCVTVDGRKYSFPVEAAKQAQTSPSTSGPINLGKLNKDELIEHASSVHGLALDASSTKAELIDQINAHVEASNGAQQS